jgi:hypothetical protein
LRKNFVALALQNQKFLIFVKIQQRQWWASCFYSITIRLLSTVFQRRSAYALCVAKTTRDAFSLLGGRESIYSEMYRNKCSAKWQMTLFGVPDMRNGTRGLKREERSFSSLDSTQPESSTF